MGYRNYLILRQKDGGFSTRGEGVKEFKRICTQILDERI